MMTPDVTTDQERRCGSVLPVVRIHRKTESGALTMTPDVKTGQEKGLHTAGHPHEKEDGSSALMMTPDVTTDQEKGLRTADHPHEKEDGSGALMMTPDVTTDQERRRKNNGICSLARAVRATAHNDL